MKKLVFLFLSILITLHSCELFEEDEIPVSALPQMYRGLVMQSVVARPVGTRAWQEFNYVTIFIGQEGKYYTMQQAQGSQGRWEGMINWHMEDGVQKVDFVDEERNNERFFTVKRYDKNHLLVEIQWGETLEEWILVTGTFNLTGVVVDESSRLPLENALVVVQSPYNTLGTVYTDQYGYFGIDMETPGITDLGSANRVYVYKEGYEDQDVEVMTNSNGYHYYPISMPGGQSGLNYGTVSGQVLDAKTGDPLEGVVISYGQPDKTVQTDYNGEYEILVPEGVQTLTASLADYDDGSQQITIEGLGEYDVDFNLELAGFLLAGTVTTADGSNVSGASLQLEDQSGNTIDNVTSSGDGSFNLEGVPDGVYLLSISATGMQFVPEQYPVSVSGGNVSDVHFLGLEEGKTGVGGQVTHWVDDTPIGDADVFARDHSTKTTADGYYIMELATGGSYILKAHKSGFINRYDETNISTGELVMANLSLAPPSACVDFTLTGRVADNDTGDPLADATVRVVDNAQSNSDASGEYNVDIDIYDEGMGQFVEVIGSKTGYQNDTVYFYIYRDVPSTYDIYLDPQ